MAHDNPIDHALAGTETRPLDWLLADLLPKIPGARAAALLSADGITLAAVGLDQENATFLSAIASGMFSLAGSVNKLATGAAETTGAEGGVRGTRQLMAELDDMMIFVRAAGERTVLAMITGREADPRHVGLQMGQLIESVKPHLETSKRGSAAEAGESMT